MIAVFIVIIHQGFSCRLCMRCTTVGCTQCISNASLSNNSIDCYCNQGFFFDPSLNKCVQCTGAACVTCSANGSYPDPYSASGQCLCPTGYYLNNNLCLPCKATCVSCTSSFCITCLNNMTFDSIANDGSCKCLDGYYLENLTCQPCDLTCSLCNKTTCLKCSSSQAVANGSICVCKAGFYLAAKATCLSCDFSCAVCNSTKCLQCFSPSGLISGKQCLCPQGMYTINANRTCLSCPSNCSACTGENFCVSCLDLNATVVRGTCQCRPGFKLVNGICVICDISCKACDLGSNCLACVDPNSYIALNKTCICNAGFFQSTLCEPCDPTCISCNSSACLECRYLNSVIVGSACRCYDGFYLTDSGCFKCNNTCLTCNSSTCLSCINYARVINGVCQCFGNRELSNGSCLCKPGYLGNETCEKCSGYMEASDFKAMFDRISFSIEIELGFVVDSITEEIDCSLIFEAESLAKMGSGPLCTWEDDENAIYIKLGNFVNISTEIYLKRSFFISSQKNCTLLQNTSLIIPILTSQYSEYSKYYQSYSIIGPTALSKQCSSQATFYCITLDGSKNIKDLVWGSVPAVPAIQSGPKVIFNVSGVETGVFEVHVTQKFYIGKSYYYKFFIDVFNSKSLQIIIKNGNYIQTRSSSDLLIDAYLLDDCDIAGIEIWKWDLLSTSQPISNAGLILSNATANCLFIPANTLKCDINYTFSLNVSKGEFSGSSVFYVFTRPEGLVIMLSRGSGSISMVSDTLIDASKSLDPGQMELTYNWQVTNYAGQYSENSSSLIIQPKYLTENQQILVTLTIKTFEDSTSTTLTLTPINLNVSVKYMYTDMRLNLPETVSINFQSSSSCTYFWQDSSNFILSDSTLLTIPALNQPKKYSFIISCNSTKYVAELDINPNLPAECLNFSLSSYKIRAYNETLTVDAFHCFDRDESDYPLKFSYTMNNSEVHLVLVSDSYESKHDFFMFPGTFFILFDVCDYLGMCSHYKSDKLNVVQNNSTSPENVFKKLKNNLNAAIIISGYDNPLDEVTKQYIWSNINNAKFVSSSDFKSFLSSASVLAKMGNFNFSGFFDVLGSNNLVFDKPAFKCLSDVHNKLITDGLGVDQVFKMNSFLVQGLESGVSDLRLNEAYHQAYENFTVYKQRYTNSSVLPSYLSSVPSVEENQIMNVQVIQYKEPYPAVSILFTASGSLVNDQFSLEPEQKIKYKDIELLVTIPCPNISNSVCLFSNETGSYANEGCSIVFRNSTHATLKLSHTSFFYISQQKNSSECAKFYLPAYLANILVLCIPVLIILFRILRKTELENEEQAQLKSDQNEEEEHKDIERTPSKVSEFQPMPRVYLIEYHLYLGAYYNGNFYFSSLKMFSILLSQISNLFFVGLLLVNLENVEKNREVSIGTVLPLGCIAFVLTLPLQTCLHYTFSKPRRSTGYAVALGFSLGVIFLVVAVVYIVMYNYSMCECWAKAWCAVYSFTIVFELIFHTVAMIVLYSARDYFFKLIK